MDFGTVLVMVLQKIGKRLIKTSMILVMTRKGTIKLAKTITTYYLNFMGEEFMEIIKP